jgi:hypothetical protein
LNDSACLPNFTKIHISVQKLLVRDTDRQAGGLISPLSFSESRLKLFEGPVIKVNIVTCCSNANSFPW